MCTTERSETLSSDSQGLGTALYSRLVRTRRNRVRQELLALSLSTPSTTDRGPTTPVLILESMQIQTVSGR